MSLLSSLQSLTRLAVAAGIAASVGLATAPVVHAQSPRTTTEDTGHAPRERRGHGMLLRMTSELGLTDAQVAEIRSLLESAVGQPTDDLSRRHVRAVMAKVLTPEQWELAQALLLEHGYGAR